MKRKITILALFLSTLLVSPIFASAGMDISLTYQKSIEDNNGETIDNPYPFSAILLPHYENGKFLMELRLPLAFGAGDESTDTFTSIDLSIYQPIKKEVSDTNSEFIFKNISHYLKLISYIQYGYDWQDFNIRFGKISNSTIGDGALLYHYRDTSIASYDTRPGLKFKLDGKYFNLGLVGIEGITNDLFTPDFYGGRIYVKPFYYTDTPILNESKIGFTEITYNSSTPSKEIYHSVALDLNIPLIKNDDYSMILYHDIINSKNFDPLSSEDLFKAKDWK